MPQSAETETLYPDRFATKEEEYLVPQALPFQIEVRDRLVALQVHLEVNKGDPFVVQSLEPYKVSGVKNLLRRGWRGIEGAEDKAREAVGTLTGFPPSLIGDLREAIVDRKMGQLIVPVSLPDLRGIQGRLNDLAKRLEFLKKAQNNSDNSKGAYFGLGRFGEKAALAGAAALAGLAAAPAIPAVVQEAKEVLGRVNLPQGYEQATKVMVGPLGEVMVKLETAAAEYTVFAQEPEEESPEIIGVGVIPKDGPNVGKIIENIWVGDNHFEIISKVGDYVRPVWDPNNSGNFAIGNQYLAYQDSGEQRGTFKVVIPPQGFIPDPSRTYELRITSPQNFGAGQLEAFTAIALNGGTDASKENIAKAFNVQLEDVLIEGENIFIRGHIVDIGGQREKISFLNLYNPGPGTSPDQAWLTILQQTAMKSARVAELGTPQLAQEVATSLGFENPDQVIAAIQTDPNRSWPLFNLGQLQDGTAISLGDLDDRIAKVVESFRQEVTTNQSTVKTGNEESYKWSDVRVTVEGNQFGHNWDDEETARKIEKAGQEILEIFGQLYPEQSMYFQNVSVFPLDEQVLDQLRQLHPELFEKSDYSKMPFVIFPELAEYFQLNPGIYWLGDFTDSVPDWSLLAHEMFHLVYHFSGHSSDRGLSDRFTPHSAGMMVGITLKDGSAPGPDFDPGEFLMDKVRKMDNAKTHVCHIVQSGDTLSELAWENNTTTWAIMKKNGITDPDRIFVGQRLVILSEEMVNDPTINGGCLWPLPE